MLSFIFSYDIARGNIVMKIKINSSVVKFNVIQILAYIATYLIVVYTNHKDSIESVLTVEQAAILGSVIAIVNIILRTTNLNGLMPVEIIRKENEETVEEKKE